MIIGSSAPQTNFGALVLGAGEGLAVVLVSEVEAIESCDAADPAAFDLAAHLGRPESANERRRLVTRGSRGRCSFETSLAIRHVEIAGAHFFSLPRAFADVEAWVKGVVLLEPAQPAQRADGGSIGHGPVVGSAPHAGGGPLAVAPDDPAVAPDSDLGLWISLRELSLMVMPR